MSTTTQGPCIILYFCPPSFTSHRPHTLADCSFHRAGRAGHDAALPSGERHHQTPCSQVGIVGIVGIPLDKHNASGKNGRTWPLARPGLGSVLLQKVVVRGSEVIASLSRAGLLSLFFSSSSSFLFFISSPSLSLSSIPSFGIDFSSIATRFSLYPS